MKQADIELQIDRLGSTIFLKGVTPAEVLYLVADHHSNSGKDPIITLMETGEAMTITGVKMVKKKVPVTKDGKTVEVEKEVQELVLRPRTVAEETQRLRGKYPSRNLNKVFGSSFEPNLPTDFAQARSAGVGVSLPMGNLVDHRLNL